MTKLTPKQRLFIAEYLVDKNGTQAAIRAGYSKKTANEQAARLLANVSIREEINKSVENQVKRVLISSDKVILGILKIAEKCSQEIESMHFGKPIINEETGLPAKEPLDPQSALRAYELLGKHLKLFTDKIDLEVKDTSEIFSKMSVEEKAKKLLENE